jgi:hypothetical protein
MTDNKWIRLLAYVTGLVNQKLLLQNEYLVAENRILRSHLPKRLRLNNPERSTLAEIGKRMGRKALSEVAIVAKPETILAWYRRLIAQKFDGSKQRKNIGRPPLAREVVDLVVRMAKENPAGATTESSERFRTSAIPFPTRRSETFSGVTALPRHRSEARRQPGKTSSRLIWRCSPESISSLWTSALARIDPPMLAKTDQTVLPAVRPIRHQKIPTLLNLGCVGHA